MFTTQGSSHHHVMERILTLYQPRDQIIRRLSIVQLARLSLLNQDIYRSIEDHILDHGIVIDYDELCIIESNSPASVRQCLSSRLFNNKPAKAINLPSYFNQLELESVYLYASSPSNCFVKLMDSWLKPQPDVISEHHYSALNFEAVSNHFTTQNVFKLNSLSLGLLSLDMIRFRQELREAAIMENSYLMDILPKTLSLSQIHITARTWMDVRDVVMSIVANPSLQQVHLIFSSQKSIDAIVDDLETKAPLKLKLKSLLHQRNPAGFFKISAIKPKLRGNSNIQWKDSKQWLKATEGLSSLQMCMNSWGIGQSHAEVSATFDGYKPTNLQELFIFHDTPSPIWTYPLLSCCSSTLRMLKLFCPQRESYPLDQLLSHCPLIRQLAFNGYWTVSSSWYGYPAPASIGIYPLRRLSGLDLLGGRYLRICDERSQWLSEHCPQLSSIRTSLTHFDRAQEMDRCSRIPSVKTVCLYGMEEVDALWICDRFCSNASLRKIMMERGNYESMMPKTVQVFRRPYEARDSNSNEISTPKSHRFISKSILNYFA